MNGLFGKDVEIQSYDHGKATLIAGVCKKLNVPGIFDQYLSKSNGRKPDISYGIMAQMMIANLCHSRRPLYLMQEYFENMDIKGIFNADVDLDQLNDDRFGSFLDKFYNAGPRKIFSDISITALSTYGLSIKNVNYDTTSKVMWGEYETSEGKVGAVSIDYGHSKAKRGDKKQIKMGLGTANGIVVDAKVLSGNMDDKTYNNQTLDEVNELLKKTNTDMNTFFYIADSSLFTEGNLVKANDKKIKFITRAPETTNMAKEFVSKSLKERHLSKSIVFENAQGKKANYYVLDYQANYKGIPVKLAVCYSCSLEDIKRKTVSRQVLKEYKELENIMKKLEKRSFACEADLKKEIEQFCKTKGKKLKYHSTSFDIRIQEKRKVGRPTAKEEATKQHSYTINTEIKLEDGKIEDLIEEACTFVLASNDLDISAEEMLKEYKTQSSVEKKFQQLKSPEFINALFVKTPERVEALTYMILIGLMILSVMEHVVRRELKKENEIILGPGKIKMTRPSLKAIMGIFEYVPVILVREKEKCRRLLQKPLKDSQLKILKYLGLDEGIFISSVL